MKTETELIWLWMKPWTAQLAIALHHNKCIWIKIAMNILNTQMMDSMKCHFHCEILGYHISGYKCLFKFRIL
jgi:hypothetical protein